jgi:RsiW-degrading membrane proteinase PrsW (M82 family)
MWFISDYSGGVIMRDAQTDVIRPQRKSLWLSNWVTFVLLGVFLLFAFAVEWLFHPTFTQTSLLLTGVVMSLIPAALWIIFFYRQDAHEPEPKGMVFSVFILGGLLAAAVGIPLVDDLYKVPDWLYDSAMTNLFGAILVIGFSQEFLKYAAVRFSVYNTAEFDERTDGIIYATSAGLGYATVLNIAFVVNSGGVDLGMGAIRIVLTALAQASFAGITGYFLSSEKLDQRPAWWMPVGISLAAILNGLFYYVWGTLKRPNINTAGGFVNPWIGLVIGAALALIVMLALSRLIARDQKRLQIQQEV